ncbi:RNA polymerase-associated protein [Ceratobasidium sp. AG-Ba]|nr:RNA polymerase-associated protein [Ceratobasidium sp. AG-Ba]
MSIGSKNSCRFGLGTVLGAYVRYLVNDTGGAPVYRLCEIVDLGPDLVKPYPLENQVTNQVLELRYGKETRHFPMDKVSNAPLTQSEMERFLKFCQGEGAKLPTKSRLEKKSQGMQRLIDKGFTDSDINQMMERKAALQQRPSHAQLLQEKSRLNQARNLARSRRDYAEVAELDVKIAELEVHNQGQTTEEDQWAKVNERNRRLNLEQTKKAEAIALAKRKALIASRSNTPKPGTPKPDDTPKQETSATSLAPPPDVVPVAPAQTTFDAMVQAVSLDIDF